VAVAAAAASSLFLFVGESYRRETGNWVAVVVFCCYFFTFAVLVTT
jgi:hypothetical protein